MKNVIVNVTHMDDFYVRGLRNNVRDFRRPVRNLTRKAHKLWNLGRQCAGLMFLHGKHNANPLHILDICSYYVHNVVHLPIIFYMKFCSICHPMASIRPA